MVKTDAQISPQVLVAQIESGTAPLILDVRTAEEYEAGHIPGAINIHFREIAERLDEIPSGPIVIYCERGIRATIAERTLMAAGIESVLHLEGEMLLWRKNKLPIEQDSFLSETNLPLTPSAVVETAQTADLLEQRWIVSAAEAKRLIDQGATLLDTRKLALKRLQDSVYVDWRQFSPDELTARGRLLNQDEVLTQKLQSLGISQQKPVVVFADPPGGWGEDGRIVWMLRTLGHSQVVMVDGGFDALVAAGVSGQQGKHVPTPGDFVVDRNGTWEIQRDELKQQLTQDNLVVIDTREAREFAG
ncbi:MAG: rhodanese-like domain-containing protein, partial [Cyanobacteria bacterium J06636_28]